MSLIRARNTGRLTQKRPLYVCGLAACMLLSVSMPATADAPVTFDPIPPQSSLAAQVEHLNILRERVAQLQSQLGQYDPGLLNAMNGLSEALISVGALREANDIVDQQIQILRITDGLYTDGQIALVHRQLSIMAAQQNWLGMQDRLTYLSWLLERSNTLSDSDKINNIKVMRDWTRLLLSRGPRQLEASYLFQLRDLEKSALVMARETTTDPVILQTMIYDYALAELYTALGMVDGSDTSQQLINRKLGLQTKNVQAPQRMTSIQDIEAVYGARTSTVIERAHRATMMHQYALIKELESTLVPADPDAGDLTGTDPEAAGMLQLYLGDSVLLRQQYELRVGSMVGPDRGQSSTGSANSYYQRAWELFLQAGYSSEALNSIFSCPVLLPLPAFSSRLEPLSNACDVLADDRLELPATALVQDSIPGLRYQAMPGSSLMNEATGVSTTLDFNIGVNGQAGRVRVTAAKPDNTAARIHGRDGLLDLQFRPALQDGKAVSTDNVTMTVYSLERG